MQHDFSRAFLAFCALSATVAAQGDDCNDPQPITVGAYGPYSTVGSTTSFPWPCATGGNDVWFVAEGNAIGSATFDTCGSSFDTCLEVFDGSGGCGALVSLGCNDDFCGSRSSVTVSVTPGQLLYLRVGGFNATVGSFVLNAVGDLGVPTGFADAIDYGSGCYNGRASFYEFIQQPANFDLSNSSFTMLFSGSDYSVVPGLATFVPPSPNATGLGMGDDTVATVNLSAPFPFVGGTTQVLEVCSNGYVSTTAGNGRSAVINVVGFLNSAATSWRNWHDYDPSAGGQVLFEEVAGVAYVTWDQVPDWSVPNSSSTFQMQFDIASGFVTFAFQQMSLTGSTGGGRGHLIGYSPGGASLDPGSIDLSAAIASSFVIPGADTFDLVLAASARPVLGTTLSLDTSNVPAAATFGLQLLGFGQINPGFDLGPLGAAGCRQYVNPSSNSLVFPSGGAAAAPLTLPNVPSLAGLHVYAQSAMLVSGVNPLGALSSNGVDLVIGVN